MQWTLTAMMGLVIEHVRDQQPARQGHVAPRFIAAE
jgi:hypothetical protein